MQSERVYQLPVSNIAYHVYLAEEDAQHLHLVSQQAFRRTLDKYVEHEALAERFQVELEHREAILKEQRDQEKLRRQQERSRQSNGHHQHSQHHRLRTRDSQEHLSSHFPLSTSSASSSGRGRGRSAQLAAISAEAAAAAEAALTQPRQGASQSSRHTSPNSSHGIGSRHQLNAQPLAPPPSQHTINVRSSSSDRSFSASPALPPSPSPRLVPMNVSDGAAPGFHQHNHQYYQRQPQDDVRSVKQATEAYSQGDGNGELHSHLSNGGFVSSRTQRKKRKQTIPVSQSIVSRIPGITLRLQAEKQGEALQVEIIKNVEDYDPHPITVATLRTERSPSNAVETKGGSPAVAATWRSASPSMATTEINQQRPQDSQVAVGESNEDVTMDDFQAEASSQAATASEGAPTATMDMDSVDTGLLASEEDHRKVRASIASGRRRAYSFLQEAVDAYQDPDEDNGDISTYLQHHRGHGFKSGIGSRSKGLHSAPSPSSQLSRGTMPLADPYSTLLPSAAGSYLPLSWENFSARDCVVNKVIGKHDKELDELEEVVQDTISRQQQFQQQLLEEQRSQSGGTETPQQQSEHTSGTHGSRHSSPHQYPSKREKHEHHHAPLTMTTRSHDSAATRHRRTPSSQNGRHATPPARDNDAPSSTTAASAKGAGTPRSSRYRQGDTAAVSTRRGTGNDTLLHYDDIERILQEKRRKKRIEKMRQSSKASSGNGDDDEREEDEAMEEARQMSVETDSTTTTREEPTATRADELVAKDSSSAISGTDKEVRSKRSMSFSGASVPHDDIEATSGPVVKRERRNSSTIHMQSVHAFGERTGRVKRPSDRAESSMASSSSSSEEEDETDLDYKHKGQRPSQSQARAGTSSSGGQTGQSTSPTAEPSTRRRARSNATLPILEMASASGNGDSRHVEAHFFNAALEMINQKRRDVLAKRRAAKLAEEAEAEAAKAEMEEKLQAAEAEKQRVADQEKRLEELRAQKIQSSNLPKSSKILPGRVRRRPPRGVDDAGYLPDACTSCQLSLTELDKTSWKEAQETKSIQLPKTWGAHAVLCSACRPQYSIHHTRCTQCFYVPMQEELAASPRCLRCRSGTWLKELLVPSAPGSNVMEFPVARPSKKSDRSMSESRRSSLAGGVTAEEDNADDDSSRPAALDGA
ncbi:hypothetical protein DFQ26_000052 [Actinomortierella ambigua]|nr:hypothetical protein DFQ26_000052 [Actinomortierella ambigua]